MDTLPFIINVRIIIFSNVSVKYEGINDKNAILYRIHKHIKITEVYFSTLLFRTSSQVHDYNQWLVIKIGASSKI